MPALWGSGSQITEIPVSKLPNWRFHGAGILKYHIVFAPKYRRKVFYNEKREDIREIIRTLCQWKGVEIIEGELKSERAGTIFWHLRCNWPRLQMKWNKDRLMVLHSLSTMSRFHKYSVNNQMCIYQRDTRKELIASLTEMRGYLDADEAELRELTDSAIDKLEAITDEQFAELELIPDFDPDTDE